MFSQSQACEAARRRWIRVEMALVLAERAGRRLGAIRQLRWEDIDWDRRTIRWRAENDKKRKEWIIPAPDDLLTELRQFQRQLGAVGDGCSPPSGVTPSR